MGLVGHVMSLNFLVCLRMPRFKTTKTQRHKEITKLFLVAFLLANLLNHRGTGTQSCTVVVLSDSPCPCASVVQSQAIDPPRKAMRNFELYFVILRALSYFWLPSSRKIYC